MYLSKLRITGFKSFPNRVEVNFPHDGITSVVGPNGCGKSNIIDAIRWVLGEQRPKALRSNKMEDVIFSGTAERSPMSLAEVSLLIHNDSGLLPSDYTQVMITRRAYRDGDSEYLINNQPCRLKDIHNLFYDTGMGAASYSLIEAKMIDTILSDKAEERRVMFEEAAGISKYKQQRKETLRQLERTAVDLARVEDSLRHVQQNVNLFERQARKAEKWRETRTACRALELSFQYDSYLRLSAEAESLQLGQAKDENRMAELDARRAAEEAMLEQERLGLFEEEQQVSALSRKAAETRNEAIRLEGEAERGRDRVGHLGESLRRLRAEAAEARTRLQELERQEAENAADTETLHKYLSEVAENALAGRSKLEEAMVRWQEARSETDELGQGRVEALETASALKQQLAAAEAELVHLRTAEDEASEDFDARGLRLAERNLGRTAAAKELADCEAAVAKASAELEQAVRAEAESAQLLVAAQGCLQELQKEKVGLETRQRILAGLEASREGMESGVKHLLGSAKDRLRSLFVDALQVPVEMAASVERALGKSLQVVLVDDRERGRELLTALRDAKKGEAVFGWPDATFRRERPNLNGKPGFKTWLIDQIVCPAEWKAILEWSLGQHALVENLEAALALTADLAGRDVWLWTPDGIGVHAGGLMVGGVAAAEGSGLLQRKAELQEVEAGLSRLRGALGSAESEIKRFEERRQAEGGRRDEWTRKLRESEQQGHALRSRLQLAESQAVALEEEMEQAKRKLMTLAERQAPLAKQAETLRGEWNRAEEERQGLENRFQAAVEKAHARETERRGIEEEWRTLEQGRAEAEGRLQAVRTRAEYLKKAQAETHDALERSARQGEEWEFQSSLQREGIETLSAEIAAIHERLTLEERDRDAVKSVYDAKAGGLEAKRSVLRDLQDELRELTRASHERSLKLEHGRSGMQSIRERMFEIHEVDLGVPEPAFERVEYDPATAPDQIAEYKEKLKSFGNINTGAVEEYEAEKARLEEVEKQFGDLDRARQGLERAIKKLDKAAREQFLATFAVVQKNFQEVFSSLFEGGEAQLALEEGVDSLDAKIEINARPTGKKMRGVSLLSGGERALTAISLLFALYLVRPSPYCIMDEVDGPLDDANIGRFVGLLRRFSHQTQFIVVTHNKRTMAASDMLYGVTQEVKGISKLVSVQLDEAARIAA